MATVNVVTVGSPGPPGPEGPPGSGSSFPLLAPTGLSGAPNYSFEDAPLSGLYYDGNNDELRLEHPGGNGTSFIVLGENGSPNVVLDSDVGFVILRGGSSVPGSNTGVIIETNGVEQLRIGSNGAWNLHQDGGGNAGDVLTSNGAGAAPTWTPPVPGGMNVNIANVGTSTLDVPDGVTLMYAIGAAGGGGGGTVPFPPGTGAGGGGGGGDSVSYAPISVISGETLTFVVGAGGAGTVNPSGTGLATAGGNTTITGSSSGLLLTLVGGGAGTLTVGGAAGGAGGQPGGNGVGGFSIRGNGGTNLIGFSGVVSDTTLIGSAGVRGGGGAGGTGAINGSNGGDGIMIMVW